MEDYIKSVPSYYSSVQFHDWYDTLISILSTYLDCPDRGKYQESKEFLIDPNKYQTCQKFWVSRLLVRMMDGRCRHQTGGRHGAGPRGGNNTLRKFKKKIQYSQFQMTHWVKTLALATALNSLNIVNISRNFVDSSCCVAMGNKVDGVLWVSKWVEKYNLHQWRFMIRVWAYCQEDIL